MENEQHIADIVAAATGGQPAAQEEPTPATEEEPTEPADGEEEEPEGPDGDETQEDEEPFEPDPASKYEKITDPKKLQGMLVSKDKGYAKMEPYAKIGEAYDKAMRDPASIKPLLEDLEKTHGIKIADVLKLAGPEKAPEPYLEPDWRKYEEEQEDGTTVNPAKEFFDEVIVPYLRDHTGKLEAEIARLNGELQAPLTEYKGSREQREFDTRVEQEAPQALRVYALRTQDKTATKADLSLAMKRFQSEKPVDALQAFKALKTSTKSKDVERPGPEIVKASERKEAKVIDPMENPSGAMEQVIGRVLEESFGLPK